MPATFVETEDLIVTRVADEANTFAFRNRKQFITVTLRSRQLTDLYHFIQRNKTTTTKNNNHVPGFESWNGNFQYEYGLISHRCNNCSWACDGLKVERHSCPKCGMSHTSINAELNFGIIRIASRKMGGRGFLLYPFASGSEWPVTINEPDLDDLLPMLYAVTGLEQIEARRQLNEKNKTQDVSWNNVDKKSSCGESVRRKITPHLHGQGPWPKGKPVAAVGDSVGMKFSTGRKILFFLAGLTLLGIYWRLFPLDAGEMVWWQKVLWLPTILPAWILWIASICLMSPYLEQKWSDSKFSLLRRKPCEIAGILSLAIPSICLFLPIIGYMTWGLIFESIATPVFVLGIVYVFPMVEPPLRRLFGIVTVR